MSTTALKKELGDAINRVAYRGERIELQRRGKNVAAIVPIEDLRTIEDLEDRIDLELARKALKEKGGIPWKKLKKDLGL